ncbi:MAG: hypothetical protein RMJ97_09075 [Raineya sp.]|nr:hypothetical protein [Raineya sp.]MDW8297017.1 hypothetical protein [Raineya sp.]
MYDYVRIHPKWLPTDLQKYPSIKWQAKNLEGSYQDYYIDEKGRLFEIKSDDYEDETFDITDENNTKNLKPALLEGFESFVYKVLYEGWIELTCQDYQERNRKLIAIFRNGKVKKVEETTEKEAKKSAIQESWQKYFKYLPSERLPMLILGVEITCQENFEELKGIKPKRNYKFEKFFYQVGLSTTKYFYATELPIKPSILPFFEKFCRNTIDKISITTSELIRYQKRLKKSLGVDCEECFKDFYPRMLPIDCTIEHIERLTSKTIPDSLHNLLSEGYFPIKKWKLWILI